MIPPTTMLKIVETMEDYRVTRAESVNVLNDVLTGLVSAAVIAMSFATAMRVITSNPSNPGNPSAFGTETETIMTRARLGEYKPPPFGVFVEREEGEVRRRKPPASIRTRDVWIYRIAMEKRDGRCRIKLYEYVSGRGDKLRAIWSGEGPYCDVKFEQISDTIRQVEFEYKTAMKTAMRE